MFILNEGSSKIKVYVMRKAGEADPGDGEQNVRGNRFPQQEYYCFWADKKDDLSNIEKLERELYATGLYFKDIPCKENHGMSMQRAQKLKAAEEALTRLVTETYPNVETVTSQEIKLDLDLFDFCKTEENEDIRAYYYEIDDFFVFIAKGVITKEDHAAYVEFENRFVDMSAEEQKERIALFEEVKQYAKEHFHVWGLVSYKKFADIRMIVESMPYSSRQTKSVPKVGQKEQNKQEKTVTTSLIIGNEASKTKGSVLEESESAGTGRHADNRLSRDKEGAETHFINGSFIKEYLSESGESVLALDVSISLTRDLLHYKEWGQVPEKTKKALYLEEANDSINYWASSFHNKTEALYYVEPAEYRLFSKADFIRMALPNFFKLKGPINTSGGRLKLVSPAVFVKNDKGGYVLKDKGEIIISK